MIEYTEAQYRADMEAAVKAWRWWQRPAVRLAIWLVDRIYGTPDRPSFGGHQPRGDIDDS